MCTVDGHSFLLLFRRLLRPYVLAVIYTHLLPPIRMRFVASAWRDSMIGVSVLDALTRKETFMNFSDAPIVLRMSKVPMDSAPSVCPGGNAGYARYLQHSARSVRPRNCAHLATSERKYGRTFRSIEWNARLSLTRKGSRH